MKTGFLLIPGGGMSAWVWKNIREYYNYPICTPEYRLKHNNKDVRKNASISDCVSYLEEEVNKMNVDKIIVLAHSGAGILAAGLAKRIPAKIRHIIYIAASIPESGKSTFDEMPVLIRVLNIVGMYMQHRNQKTEMLKYEKMIRKNFCNTSSESTIQYILKQDLLSEPFCLGQEKVDWSEFPVVKQTYIKLSKDRTVSIKIQERMMSNLNIKDYREIESDHMVMLSHPDELIKAINDIYYNT